MCVKKHLDVYKIHNVEVIRFFKLNLYFCRSDKGR